MNLGLAVQDAVEATLKSLGLAVRLVDRGYDFRVSYSSFEEGSVEFLLEDLLVEVKATTTDSVRMTPTQASTAAASTENYVLCVVDLRGLPEERLDKPWCAEDILLLAKITRDIGAKVRSTWQLIEQARGGTVSITGEGSLRYEVPKSIWAHGCSIRQWLVEWPERVPDK
jgi:hypothetical protein